MSDIEVISLTLLGGLKYNVWSNNTIIATRTITALDKFINSATWQQGLQDLGSSNLIFTKGMDIYANAQKVKTTFPEYFAGRDIQLLSAYPPVTVPPGDIPPVYIPPVDIPPVYIPPVDTSQITITYPFRALAYLVLVCLLIFIIRGKL